MFFNNLVLFGLTETKKKEVKWDVEHPSKTDYFLQIDDDKAHQLMSIIMSNEWQEKHSK